MSTVPFSQQVSDLRTMAGGIATRLDELDGSGVLAADVTILQTFATELDALNAQREDLKAQLKGKTKELKNKLKESKAKHSNVSKRIKLSTPQENWKAFGITVTR
jgi:phage-related protein